MSAEPQKSELLSDDNAELKTFGDYAAKYRILNQQIVSAKYQMQLLKNTDSRYQTQRFAKLIPQLHDTMFEHMLEIEAVALAISHAMAWIIDPEDRKIVSDATFSNRTLAEIAHEHSVSERCIRNLLQEYNQIPIPNNIADEYWEKVKRRR